MTFEVQPVTAERWGDLVSLFGERGASSGCWCMWFRARPHPSDRSRALNRATLESLVTDDRVPGLLGYRDGEPVGWVSVAPRPEYERIAGPASGTEADALGCLSGRSSASTSMGANAGPASRRRCWMPRWNTPAGAAQRSSRPTRSSQGGEPTTATHSRACAPCSNAPASARLAASIDGSRCLRSERASVRRFERHRAGP